MVAWWPHPSVVLTARPAIAFTSGVAPDRAIELAASRRLGYAVPQGGLTIPAAVGLVAGQPLPRRRGDGTSRGGWRQWLPDARDPCALSDKDPCAHGVRRGGRTSGPSRPGRRAQLLRHISVSTRTVGR
jgi:hypothetical protein